jgi:hypothetical protein
MNLTLHLSPDVETKLREQAAALGKPLEDVALEALKEKLASEPEPGAVMPLELWLREFRAFTAESPRGNVNADVSRDSIYEGRGE